MEGRRTDMLSHLQAEVRIARRSDCRDPQACYLLLRIAVIKITDTTGIHADALHQRCRIDVRLLQCRSEEHTSELQSLMRISYAVFCLNKKTKVNKQQNTYNPTQ